VKMELPSVWTARYSNPVLPDSGLVPVRISRGYPRFRLRYQIAGAAPELMPSREILGLEEEAPFESAFVYQLDASGVDSITERLASFSGLTETGVVLLCFEDLSKPGVWCHRRIFARWWERRGGGSVPELPEHPLL
jgi:hypothetical protein